jgi:cytochrome P450
MPMKAVRSTAKLVVAATGCAAGLHLLLLPWTNAFLRVPEMRPAYGAAVVVLIALLNVAWTDRRRTLLPALLGSAVIGLLSSFVALQIARPFQVHASQSVIEAARVFGAASVLTVDIAASVILGGWLVSIAVGLFVRFLRR